MNASFSLLFKSFSLCTNPVPPPPRIYEGLSIRGYPIFLLTLIPSWIDLTYSALRVLIPTFSIAFLNFHRFSATSIDFAEAPNSFILFCAKILFSSSSIARFSAVWPPKVGKTASGFSISIIFLRNSNVNGSMYVASAIFGSVIIVAGFEFTNIILYPSFFKALAACDPE